MKTFTSTFILFVLCTFAGYAQKDTSYSFDKHHYWLTVGFGKSTPVFDQINIGASLLFTNRKVIQADYYTLSINRNLRGNSLSKLQSFVLSYGINTSFSRHNSLITAAGISFGKGNYVGVDTATDMLHLPFVYRVPKYIQSPYKCIGLCLNAQYLFRIKNYGLGVKMYFNMHKHSDLGVSFTGHLGYLNKKKPKSN